MMTGITISGVACKRLGPQEAQRRNEKVLQLRFEEHSEHFGLYRLRLWIQARRLSAWFRWPARWRRWRTRDEVGVWFGWLSVRVFAA